MYLVGCVELPEWVGLFHMHVVVYELDVHWIEGAAVSLYPRVDVIVDCISCTESFIFCETGVS